MAIYQHAAKRTKGDDAANLCADEKPNAQPNSKTRTKVILWPQIVRHILNNGPIRLALLLVGDSLLGQQGIILARWLGRLCCLGVLRLDALFRRLLLLHRLLLYGLYPLGILAVSRGSDEDSLGLPRDRAMELRSDGVHLRSDARSSCCSRAEPTSQHRGGLARSGLSVSRGGFCRIRSCYGGTLVVEVKCYVSCAQAPVPYEINRHSESRRGGIQLSAATGQGEVW